MLYVLWVWSMSNDLFTVTDMKHNLMGSSPALCLWFLSLMFYTAVRFAHALLFLVFSLPRILELHL